MLSLTLARPAGKVHRFREGLRKFWNQHGVAFRHFWRVCGVAERKELVEECVESFVETNCRMVRQQSTYYHHVEDMQPLMRAPAGTAGPDCLLPEIDCGVLVRRS